MTEETYEGYALVILEWEMQGEPVKVIAAPNWSKKSALYTVNSNHDLGDETKLEMVIPSQTMSDRSEKEKLLIINLRIPKNYFYIKGEVLRMLAMCLNKFLNAMHYC